MSVRPIFPGCIVALACAACATQAQDFPARPVRLVVPVSAGGGVDIVARIIGQHMSALWGQPFIVDNRTGAGGSIGVEIVARAAPDGHTLLVSSSTMVTTAVIRESRYHPVNDFRPIAKLTSNPYILLVAPSLPVNSVKELIAIAKSKPDTVTFASAGQGSVLHLGAELFTALTGTRMTHVPYKGVTEAYPAVASGQVNWILGSPISALPLMKAGRMKGIAVSSAARSRSFPDLPTIAESGVPGYEVTAWFSFFAPARVPTAIVGALHAEALKAMRAPEVVRRMDAEGTDIAGGTAQEFAAEVRREYDKWQKVVKQGLKL